MLHVRLTVRAPSVLSVPRPLERPEAAESNISHPGGKRPRLKKIHAHAQEKFMSMSGKRMPTMMHKAVRVLAVLLADALIWPQPFAMA